MMVGSKLTESKVSFAFANEHFRKLQRIHGRVTLRVMCCSQCRLFGDVLTITCDFECMDTNEYVNIFALSIMSANALVTLFEAFSIHFKC